MTIQKWWADMPSEQLMESAWERQMSLAGIEAYEQSRYRENGSVQAASESRAGQKIMRKLINDASEGIEAMQKEVIEAHRVDRTLKGTVLLVPAETAALITLKHIMDASYAASDFETGANYQVLCKEVAKSIELELNFRNWVKASQEAAEAYAKANGMSATPRSMADKLIADHGLSERTLRRWKQTFEDLNAYQWDTLEQHYCGEALVKTVVETLTDTFEIHTIFTKGKKQNYVRMKPEARAKLDEIEQQIVRMQVVKKPMLSRPRKWVRHE